MVEVRIRGVLTPTTLLSQHRVQKISSLGVLWPPYCRSASSIFDGRLEEARVMVGCREGVERHTTERFLST